jgi:hypothetical protein
MKVQFWTLANGGESETFIFFDEYMLVVRNLGCGDYAWKVQATVENMAENESATSLRERLSSSLDCHPAESDGYYSSDVLGSGLIWASPVTFAHVVGDLIRDAWSH